MNVITIETASLGDRSYIVHDGTVGLVVDPQRDIQRVVDEAERAGIEITHVAETHVHNDYVSGGLTLARVTGATYLHAAAEPLRFDYHAVNDGDSIDVGSMTVVVKHTPGHTPHHLSHVVTSGEEAPVAFTGGSMLYGTVGRTDLIDRDSTDELSRAQYRSVHALADSLPDETRVYPTHGFGSFCASVASEFESDGTLGTERTANIALTATDEDAFVDELIAGLDAFPKYYAQDGPAEHGWCDRDRSLTACCRRSGRTRTPHPSRGMGRRPPQAPTVRRLSHFRNDRCRARRRLLHLPRLACPLGHARHAASRQQRRDQRGTDSTRPDRD